MKNYILPFLFLFVQFISVSAQENVKLDSLNKLLSSPITDSLKGYVLDELSYEWFYHNLDSSLYYGKKAHQVFKKQQHMKGLGQSLVSIAVAYHYKNHWDSAEHYYKKSLDVRIKLEDRLGQAKSLNNLGVLFLDKGDLEEATQYFLNSLSIREQLNDAKGVAMGQVNLGLIFRKQGNYDKAIAYYAKALEFYEALGESAHLAIIYLNLGALYNYQNSYDLALQYNLKAHNTAKTIKSTRSYGKSCVNLSDSYLGLGQTDSSLYFTKEAIRIFIEISDTVDLALALNTSSALNLSKGNYKKALESSLWSEKLNFTMKNKDLQMKNALNLSEAYAGLGEMNKAYASLKKASIYKDSLVNESLNESINKLNSQYEAEQKERTIAELELQQKTSDLAIITSQNQRNIFILIAAIVVLLSLFLYLLLRSKTKTNAIISTSLEEKETLLKEIHHRVKNNLQVISSLLSLQAESLDNEQAAEAVKEGQNRVKSMALIHQKLYQDTDLRGVDIKIYLDFLTRELFNTYGIDTENISCQINTNGLKLDIDTVIPLGLIINELVTNTLKYAFDETRSGELLIQLEEKEEKLELLVKDNGKGTDETTIKSANSFGWKIIESLSRKLKADVTVLSGAGTTVQLIISRYKLVL